MAKNFYNLPPAWNPGYAIPRATMDEGLERRAFTTAMLPRGTYDDPAVSNHGYAVPSYVDDEGYGQGAMITKWLPRGYYGPGLPAWLDQKFTQITGEARASGRGVVLKIATLSGMGDVDPYPSKNLGQFGTYGRRAAAALISSVDKLPPRSRPAAIRQAMDAIDPKLYHRAAALGEAARRQGMPPRSALAHGIAAAMTEGVLNELHQIGSSRTAPQPRSLLGLGCYGCIAALGADDGAAGLITKAINTYRICEGYSWTGSAWTVTRAGQQDVPAPPGVACPAAVREHVMAGPGAVVAEVTSHPTLQVGPFAFEINAREIRDHQALPPDQQKWVTDHLKIAAAAAGNSPAAISRLTTGVLPFAKFKRPAAPPARSGEVSADPYAGKMFGLYYTTQPGGGYVLTYKEYVRGDTLFEAIWKGIKTVAAVIVDVVKDAVDLVGDLTCGLVSSPGAAGAAATASGGAAAVGVAIAGGMCTTGQPPPGTTIPPPETNYTMPMVVIGGGALLLLLLSKKKKASTP